MRTTGVEDEVAELLARAADGAAVGPAPVGAVIRGGRRRRTRRAVLRGALALAVIVPLGGVAVSVAREDRAAQVAQTPKPSKDGEVSVDLGTTTIDGKVFHAQLTLSRIPEDPNLQTENPPPGYYGSPEGPWPWAKIVFNSQDGRSVTIDYRPEPAMPDPEGVFFRSSLATAWKPDGGTQAYTMTVGRLKPEYTRAVITWKDGSTSEPKLQAVPRSDRLWLIAASMPGVRPDHVDLYDANGNHTQRKLG